MMIYIKIDFLKNPLVITNLLYKINCWYKINGKAIVYNTPYLFMYSPLFSPNTLHF
jgi:hypothetical protein